MRVLGYVALLVMPALFLAWTVLTVLSYPELPQVGLLPLFAAAVYAMYLLSDVTYDSQKIRSLDLGGLPDFFKNVARETTQRGDRLYVILLRAFDDVGELSQTDLTAEAERNGVELSRTRVTKYIDDLVGWGLIISPPTEYRYKYTLTEKGRWCRRTLDLVLPRRNVSFILRNYVGYRRIVKLPEQTPSTTSN